MEILVVDDDVQLCAILQEFLEDHGYKVHLAYNGMEALKVGAIQRPACIVLDVEMPGMLGFEVCKKLREIEHLRHTPIIMLTGLAGEKHEVTGLQSGADDYVNKPFKPKSLLARIEAAVGRNSTRLEASPLTHLPGNQMIAREIETKIREGKQFSVLYLDINNFKSFNDRYGFLRGDEAIRKTADVISTALHKMQDKNFLGHVGGDDFIAIVDTHEVEQLCREIIAQFDIQIRKLYDKEDVKRGMIMATDRQGKQVEIPIMGLAIAVVTNKLKSFQHPGEVSLIAGDLKKWVKGKSESAFAIDRRS